MWVSKKLADVDFIQHGFYDKTDSGTVENPFLMNQVHSVDTCFVTSETPKTPSVDALITTQPGILLTVKTADCAPILMVDPKQKIIAAVHAGWKGAVQGIIENTVLQMMRTGANPDQMIAAVGPHLMQQSFEVQPDFRALFPVTEQHFFHEGHFDFTGYVVHRLNRAGIRQIDVIDTDTFTSDRCYSYRREPNNPGREYSVIALK